MIVRKVGSPMFFTNIRIQLAAICVLVLILLDYLRRPRLPVQSARFFMGMLLLACANLGFDIMTVYTITHMDTVAPVINRLCHQLFIGSLNALAYCLFLYVSILSREQRRIERKTFFFLSVPFFLSMLATLFAPLEYFNDGTAAYSYGMMANILYVDIAFYIVLVDVYMHNTGKSFSKKKKTAVVVATAIWIIAAVIQYLVPSVLLSGLGVALMILYIYLTFENPTEHHDREAGCFNRAAFGQVLTELCEAKRPFFVMNLILEDLPQINERYGAITGAKVLHHAASVVQQSFGTFVFHYRGNSISIISKGSAFPQKELDCVQAVFDKTWTIQNQRLCPLYRIDVISCPQYAADPNAIYAMLDYMFTKPDGESHIRLIHDVLAAEQDRSAKLEALVTDAVHNNGLEVFYQPIFSVERGRYISAEALVRLKDRQTLGFISPEEFIPIAERNGLITALGEAVLRQVCAFAKQFYLRERGIEYIEVNLSGIQMADPELAPALNAVMKEYEIDPSFINFEVTESVAVSSGQIFADNMKSLRSLGSSFSLDDFGTGYSNLSQIVAAKYDLIKFDKSLIWPCFGETPEHPRIVLSSIVNMATGLNMHIVAEGVETKEQAEYLSELGVTYLQGYYYAKPLNASAFLAAL